MTSGSASHLSVESVAPTGGACVREAGRLPRPIERGLAAADASYAVACALDLARPRGGPDLPIVVAAAPYNSYGANRFVTRHDTKDVRMLPVDSTALEPSGILQAFIALTGWSGRGHLVTSDRDARPQALAWARAALALGSAEAVLFCEVTGDEAAGFGAVAATLWPTRAQADHASPATCAAHPPEPA